MQSVLVVLAVAALGIEVGWEPLDGGGHEYTIQIEPEMIDLLKQGDHELGSTVPPNLDVRRYRIVVGKGKLARVTAPAAPAAPAHQEAEQPKEPAAPTVAAPQETQYEPADEVPHDAAAIPPAEPRESPHVAPAPKVAESGRDSEAPKWEQAPMPELSKWPDKLGQPDEAEQRSASRQPAELPHTGQRPAPLGNKPAAFNSGAEPAPTEKHTREKTPPPGDAAEPGRPWLPFLTALVLLCCSVGGNIYLGWVAWEARTRYRDALLKFRRAPAQ